VDSEKNKNSNDFLKPQTNAKEKYAHSVISQKHQQA